MRIAWVLTVVVALLVPATSNARGARKEMRGVARELLSDLREDALTVGASQRFVVGVVPGGCKSGCLAQGLLSNGTGQATSRPGGPLKLKIRIPKALRDKVLNTGRARAVLQLSVTDIETGAVANLEREIPLRS